MGVGESAPRPGCLYPRERPYIHFTEGWVGPRAGLDGRKISSPSGFDVDLVVCSFNLGDNGNIPGECGDISLENISYWCWVGSPQAETLLSH